MLLIGGRQRLNSLGGQHTNMKITFGLWLDGCPPTSQAALAEKKLVPQDCSTGWKPGLD